MLGLRRLLFWPFRWALARTRRYTASSMLRCSRVTPGFSSVIGQRFLLGRAFLLEEGEIGRNHVAILTHQFWLDRFGDGRSIVSRTVQMNGGPYTIRRRPGPGPARSTASERRYQSRWPSSPTKPTLFRRKHTSSALVSFSRRVLFGRLRRRIHGTFKALCYPLERRPRGVLAQHAD
jgi:hypothetical protein